MTVELPGGPAATIRRPNLIGAVIGKASAVVKVVSLSPGDRTKHTRDLDALARLLAPQDRSEADLSRSERKLLLRLCGAEALSPLARASLHLLVRPPA